MNGFLKKEDGINNFPLGYEAPLVLRDEAMNMRFEAHGKNFSDELIRGVAERDGSKSRE